ncbi:hypothetical protein AA14337_3353 [Acetobacter malorum DSM 14337]|uniref:Uncharacterized protein n=2 Tax=Acetobacter TaxID=434 RepID=A0A1U9LJ39_9PROT|nr:hypothetical protein A0U91_14900 [Acetobacter persici]KXV06498.1 hypothetical protein AD930_07805 [Acetobacter malorum]GBQ86555.1 hypothetical protein AA14337_3353 [Acetobacter malorum DSM 14337]
MNVKNPRMTISGVQTIWIYKRALFLRHIQVSGYVITSTAGNVQADNGIRAEGFDIPDLISHNIRTLVDGD